MMWWKNQANRDVHSSKRVVAPSVARRHTIASTAAGFTIIELLIVITVIAILAAITIVAYNGVTQKADIATLQSDLSNGYDSLGAASAVSSTYPATQSDAGLKSSPGVSLAYMTSMFDQSGNDVGANGAYCLQAAGFGEVYAVTESNNVPTQGYCSYGTFVAGTGNSFLSYPAGVTVDSSGDIYIADSVNNCIRKVTPSGSASVFAGICGGGGTADGTGPGAEFDYPTGLAFDSSGNLYVADLDNNCIRKITPSAVVTTFAGTCNSNYPGSIGAADGTGSAAQFYSPDGLAFDSSGNLYVADEFNSCIRQITPSAVVTTFAGTCNSNYPSSAGTADGTGSAAQFNVPDGLAFDSSGNLYVADGQNSCIRQITPSAVVTTFAGTCGTSGGTADGTGSAAQLHYPDGLAFDSSGNLYVADQYNNCIREITPSAVVTTFAGTCGTSGGTADGTGSAAQFFGPDGLAFDSSGNLYVADTDNSCIRKITPTAVVTTLPVGGC